MELHQSEIFSCTKQWRQEDHEEVKANTLNNRQKMRGNQLVSQTEN